MIHKIAVIGPGMMGHAIAQEFAAAGITVRLFGRSEKRLEEALNNIRRNLNELVSWDMFSSAKVAPAMQRIYPTTDLTEAGSNADLILEAVVEDLEIKHDLYRRLDAICPNAVEGPRMDAVIAAEAKAKGVSEKEIYDNLVRGTSMRTFVTKDDVTNMVLFLCSESGCRISGQALSIDGHTETLR